MRPYMDKHIPEAMAAAEAFATTVRESARARGVTAELSELMQVRSSQLNACAFCLDLHTRRARQEGIPQQKIDLLPAWRETDIYSAEETAVLAIAEAATRLPLTEDARADLSGARVVLGEERFVAAEWVAVAINTFNRISVLSQHQVRPRDAEGKVIR